MVVFSHVYASAGYPYLAVGVVAGILDMLHSGVDLFFVLSGFCLYYPLTKTGDRRSWPEFFRRRAKRLLPPYYAAIATIALLPFAIAPMAGYVGLIAGHASWPSWHQLWTHLLLVHTLGTDTFFGLNGPFWSLGIEVQFYIAFPVAVWLVQRLGWRGVCLIAALTVSYRIACVSGVIPAYQPIDLADLFPSRWLEFALGMLVARQVRKNAQQHLGIIQELTDLAGVVLVFLLVAYVLYGPLRQWPYPPKDLLFACLYSALLYRACCRGSLLGVVLGHRIPVWLGTISYSLYLIHLPIILALGPSIMAQNLGLLGSLLGMAVVCVPLVVGGATCFYVLFERPFLNRPPQPGIDLGSQMNRR